MRLKATAYFYVACCLILTCFLQRKATAAVQTEQAQEENSRQIFEEGVTNARAAVQATPSSSSRSNSGRSQTRPANTRRRNTYRRSATKSPAGAAAPKVQSPSSTNFAELGITVWRLRPSTKNDSGARLLVQESGEATEWTPERIPVDAPLSVGDRVRISIESPRTGYLYVIDREQYADGSVSDPYLIFPNRHTQIGDIQVKAGKLVDVPSQTDRPNYFLLKPGRQDQVGELLSLIVSPEPLGNFTFTEGPLRLSKAQVEGWEKVWSTSTEKFELEGGAGKTWTKEEQAASVTSGRLLTQQEPAPQTIYKVAIKPGSPLLVVLPLQYGKPVAP